MLRENYNAPQKIVTKMINILCRLMAKRRIGPHVRDELDKTGPLHTHLSYTLYASDVHFHQASRPTGSHDVA